MLAIQKSKTHQGTCTPNALPCRINHNGSVNASKRFWDPQDTAESTKTSYFRGRKLQGTTVKLPEGYTGAVICSTDKEVNGLGEEIVDEQEKKADNREFSEAEKERADVMVVEADFEEIVVWGHEAMVDGSADAFARGVGEWFAFSEQINSH